MRIFKPQFKDRATGATRETQKWYLDFRDHRQIRRRIPADRCRTTRDAERFGAMVENLVTARQYGQRPDRGLTAWLHGLPRHTLKKLTDYDLIDGERLMASVPLSQHAEDFENWLRTSKARHGFSRSAVYIHNTMHQVRYIIEQCGFRFWTDVTKGAVENCLGALAVKSKTFNAYQASFKLFADWMVQNGRAELSPVKAIRPVRWTKTESRRALTREEAVALLRATAGGPRYYRMSGVERAVLYLTAMETGYRLKELRSLTVGCFDLENACVNLGAQHTKNHLDAAQLIKRSRAGHYRAFLGGRGPDEPVFALPGNNEVLEVFRRDLEAAGIAPVDERGAKVVFHCLRYTLSTALDKSGATLKERMMILRHSDKGNLTLGTYTTPALLDLRGAVEGLPDYPWPPAIEQAPAESKLKKGVA